MIVRQIRIRKKLKWYAQIDSLTGLLNRGSLFSQGEKLFLESENISAPGRVRVLGSGSVCGANLERYKSNIFFNILRKFH